MSQIDIDDTLKERGARYGSYTIHSITLEQLEGELENLSGWKLARPICRRGAIMILDKLTRAFNGDPYYIDNWLDIEGYAKLVRTNLETQYQEELIPNNKATIYICSLFHPNRLHLFDKHCCNMCHYNQQGVCSKHNFVNAYKCGDKCYCKQCNREVKCNGSMQNFMIELIQIYNEVSITDLETEIYNRFPLLNEVLNTNNNNLTEDDRSTLEEICVKVVGNVYPEMHTFDLHYTIRDIVSRYFIRCDRFDTNPIFDDIDDNRCEHCKHWYNKCMFDRCKYYKEYQSKISAVCDNDVPKCEHGNCVNCINCEVMI